MFAICIESSHKKGMGHLFRMLNFTKNLEKHSKQFIFIVNDNEKTHDILNVRDIPYEVVDLVDYTSNWETKIIHKHKVRYWLNDRLDTNQNHSINVKNTNTKLVTFDDLGSGAKYSDINVCGLFFDKKTEGKKILKGIDFLILNNEIDQYKRERTHVKNIIVTLGGSDTYGVTIKVLNILIKNNIKATIHVGPSFEHVNELKKILTDNYKVVKFLPSLIEEFNKYDLAITGGGITPFEANASGLPCLIVANEYFEIPNGYFLDELGSSVFLGFHEDINEDVFNDLYSLSINNMSLNGMSNLNTNAVEKIYSNIVEI